ncbi:MAG: bis(5'-nucleosyl)-tetraphosphatase (symmetrical) YqeK [Lachnospiraceae bacterium]|nr:bis(5'-nucleosyl)-tetraphosphatase (symmetrical) YqeK [Lachnospiraceae bacterium]
MKKEKIKEHLKKALKPGRYEHTLGVEYTAACLAMRYGCNMEQADLAGLLHDCAKCISNKDKLSMCKEKGIKYTKIEKDNPELLHAKLGAVVANEIYGINDEEILSAIRCHTTGKPEMTLLEKIIFVADYIEPNRNKAPELEKIRQLAFENIDQCLIYILKQTLDYLNGKTASCDPMTLETYHYYTKQEVQ